MLELRDEQVVRQQWDLSCGAAAIATVLTYQLNHPVSEREVALAMLRHTTPNLVRSRLGFSLLDLKAYAATHGFAVAAFSDMTLDDLDPLAPAITPIRWHGFSHFVVYRGRRAGRVLIADPAFGNRTLTEDGVPRGVGARRRLHRVRPGQSASPQPHGRAGRALSCAGPGGAAAGDRGAGSAGRNAPDRNRSMTRTAAFGLAAGAALIAAAPAFAQPLTRQELEAALKERDAQIELLEKRVAALEAEHGASAAASQTAQNPSSAGGDATAGPVATTSAAASGPQGAAGGVAASAPGDEDQLRALSRGLVERGLQLLPKGSVEVSPSVAYSHSQIQGLVLVQTPEGISTVDDQRQRDDFVEGALTARVGLPWRSQFQMIVPVDWRREDFALGDGTTVAH